MAFFILVRVSAAATVKQQSSALFFTFRPHWDDINVSSAAAVGGYPIAVSGSGFRAADVGYSCEFSMGSRHASSPAQSSRSGSLILCEAPFWPYSYGRVLFSLNHYSSGVPVDDEDFDVGNGECRTYQYGGVNSGFCLSDVACESCARSCEAECAMGGIGSDSQVVLHHKYGTTSHPPSITCSGSCPCTASTQNGWDDGGFMMGAEGMFDDGSSTADYASHADCQWLISAASDIFLRFTSFEIESGYDFVAINTCTSSDCRDAQQIARLTGSVSPSRQFISSTGYMQVLFQTDDQVNGPGFETHVTFADLNTQAIPYRYDGIRDGNFIELKQCLRSLSADTTQGLASGGDLVTLVCPK